MYSIYKSGADGLEELELAQLEKVAGWISPPPMRKN